MDAPPDRSGLGEARRFASNALWLLIGDLVAKGASLLFVIVVARGLGTVEYGYFNFAVSFIPLFLIVGAWGLDNIFFRELAQHRDELSRYYSSGLAVRVLLGAGALIVGLGAGPFFIPAGDAFVALILVGVALFLDELSSFVSTVFRAFEMMRYRAFRIMVNRILTTTLALVAVAFDGDLVLICAMYMAGSFGALVYSWWALRRHFPTIDHRSPDRSIMRSLVRDGMPLALAGALNMAVFRIDALMLQAIKGPVQVAFYGVAYRFLDSFMFIAWSFGNVALPRIARSESEGQERTFEISLALIVTAYLPLAIAAFFLGNEMVALAFGDRYRAAGHAVFWLMAAGVFYGAAYLGRMACIAIGRTSAIARLGAAALVVNVIGNSFLIPAHGFEGAAVMTMATSALEGVGIVAVFLRHRGDVRWDGPILVPLLAALPMILAMWLLDGSAWAAAIVGAVVFALGTVIGARVLAPELASVATSLLRRRRPASTP